MKNWDYEKPKFECDEINGDLLITLHGQDIGILFMIL